MTANKKAGLMGWSTAWRKPADSGRTTWDTVEIVATSVIRPVIVTAAVFGAVLGSIPAAHADGIGDSMAPVLNGAGIGNNGPVSGAISQMGQSICPMLVKPGGSLASTAAQMTGHGGFEAPMAGFLAQMAIQSQCPGWINSMANGNMPFPLPGAGGPGLPFGLPGSPPSLLPGIAPAGPQPGPFGF
jgi:hypothetical protein